jgi:hypothetical protein
MRPRDESAHPVINHAIEQGHLDTGKPYAIHGFTSHDAANEGRLSVNRGGKHLNVATPSWVVDEGGNPCYKACSDPEGPHSVYFRLHSKDSARKHVVAQSGGDPANLKYNPFARGQRPLLDDSGQRL